jgi:hypothetical protein
VADLHHQVRADGLKPGLGWSVLLPAHVSALIMCTRRRIAALLARSTFQRGFQLPDRRNRAAGGGIERQARPGPQRQYTFAALAGVVRSPITPSQSAERRSFPSVLRRSCGPRPSSACNSQSGERCAWPLRGSAPRFPSSPCSPRAHPGSSPRIA